MNIAVGQSGGPTCAINASLAGVFKAAVESGKVEKVYGSVYGIEGILKENLVVLNDYIKSDEDLELIKQTPSTLLNSCRFKLPDMDKDASVYEKIAQVFKKFDIGAFFYIGGNDSMDTVNKISAYFAKVGCDIKVVGIPKTIDNDLMCTDHTPGFGSAAKYVATTLKEIVRDCTVYDVKSVTIIEIMGRDTGWLTASSALLHTEGETAPHLIYLPECEFSLEKFLADIQKMHETENTVVVAISEGVEVPADECGGDITSGVTDNFGHKYLAGIGKFLENTIRSRLGCKVRSIELNTMQRCASHIASKTDIDEAEAIGMKAVYAALEGKTGHVMIMNRVSNAPYTLKIESAEASKIANNVKYFPKEWITPEGNGITKEGTDYILPLIQGERNIIFENGLPKHFKLK